MNDSPELELNPTQVQILHQFPKRVQDLLRPEHDSHFLLKWLKVCNFDIGEAEKMLRNHFAWREEWGVDTILEDFEPPEVLSRYWPGSHAGYDKEGYPFVISPFAQGDVRGVRRSVKKKEFLKFLIQRHEYLLKMGFENGKKLGKRIDKITHICDLEGLQLALLWAPGVSEFINEMLPMMEANYPDFWQHILIINAPSIFPLLFSIIQPFLEEETQKRVKILESNWREQILEFIDADQLPVYWGGTCTDPDGDPRCPSRIIFGGEIPESYYRIEQVSFDPGKSKTVIVGAQSSHKVVMSVDKPGAVVKWMFQTKHNDIKVSMCQMKDSGDRELMPATLVNSHLIPEEGALPCHEPGTYVLTFDNTYSWVYSKEVTYQIEIDYSGSLS